MPADTSPLAQTAPPPTQPKPGEAPTAPAANPIDTAFEALKRYDWGQDPQVLQAIEKAMSASKNDPAVRKDLEVRLTAILKTDAPLAAKQYACRALSRIGTADSVHALAALLADEALSHMGRLALERMPCPEAAGALRSALPPLKGALKIGLIHTLAARRDIESVPSLTALLADQAPGIAAAAATALGVLGTPDAAKALRAFLEKAPKEALGAAADGSLSCAERLAANGEKGLALEIYQTLSSAQQPPHVRQAATLGQAATGPGK